MRSAPNYYSSQQLAQTLGIAKASIVELQTKGYSGLRAAGHALARPVENVMAKWLATPAWQCEEVPGYCFEVEPVEFPEWPWWRESDGFIVRRIPEEQTRND